MTLAEYIKHNSRTKLASDIGVSTGMISQWLNNTRPIAIGRCVAIEKATEGQVTRKELRPDDWAIIWPELLVETQKTSLAKQAGRKKE